MTDFSDKLEAVVLNKSKRDRAYEIANSMYKFMRRRLEKEDEQTQDVMIEMILVALIGFFVEQEPEFKMRLFNYLMDDEHDLLTKDPTEFVKKNLSDRDHEVVIARETMIAGDKGLRIDEVSFALMHAAVRKSMGMELFEQGKSLVNN